MVLIISMVPEAAVKELSLIQWMYKWRWVFINDDGYL